MLRAVPIEGHVFTKPIRCMVSILVCRDKKVDVTIMRMVLFIVEETKPVVSIAQNFILKIRHPSLTDEK